MKKAKDMKACLRTALAAAKKISLKNVGLLTLAGVINAFGITVFLSPVRLYDSGISGTSMLLAQLTPRWLSLSLLLLFLNIPLFLYGLKRQGRRFTLCAIYTVAVYAVAAWVITEILPIDVNVSSPLAGSDLLLCALFGGIISGVGSGLAIRCGGAMDGIEVLAVIFAKSMGITVGTFVMIYTVILYVLCGVLLSSWILPLYSIVAYMAALKTVDFLVEGIDRAKCAMIVTKRPDEICSTLAKTFGTGSTRVEARGGYTNETRYIVYFVVNRFQIIRMKDIVHQIDPGAFITISEVADLFRANQT